VIRALPRATLYRRKQDLLSDWRQRSASGAFPMAD